MGAAHAADEEAATVRSLLRHGAAGTAALHAAARGLGFLTTLVLASVLGAADFGAYAWAMATIAILRVPAALGRERLLVREVAQYAAHGDWGLLRGVLGQAARVVAVASLVLAAACTGVAVAVDAPLADALGQAAVLLPLGAFLLAAQAALQGLQRVVAAVAPDALLRPLALLALLGAGALVTGMDWTSGSALAASAFATFLALVATAMLLRRHLPAEVVRAAPAKDARAWNRSGLVLAANAMLGIVSQRGDLVLVGLLAGPADAGVYGVAVAAASVPAVALMAGTAPLAPLVARLHSLGRREPLAHAVRSATRAIFAATLAIAAVLAAAGPLTLDLLGSSYGAGAGALALLCLAAVVNAAFAANTLALLMTGHERAAATATGAGAATTVLGALVLVPALGIDGAALAALAGVVVRNGLATRSAWTTLGLDTSLRGARRR